LLSSWLTERTGERNDLARYSCFCCLRTGLFATHMSPLTTTDHRCRLVSRGVTD